MSYLGEAQDFQRQNRNSPFRIDPAKKLEVQRNYERSADTALFDKRSQNFDRFQSQTGGGNISGAVPQIDGKYMLNVQQPRLTAMKPTFAQAFGDFRRGAGNFLNAVGERVGPLPFLPGNIALSDMMGGIKNFFTNQPNQAMNANMINMGGNLQGNMMNAELEQFNSLNRSQQNTYNMLRGQGLNHPDAFSQAIEQKAMGGIASLN